MTKIIKINCCKNCFFVRELADEDKTYCCIRQLMSEINELGTYKIKNIKRIPKWCPLEDYK